MKYMSGEEIKIGDFIQLWAERYGYVVCSISDQLFSKDYLEEDWGYLKEGIIIKMDNDELIHYVIPDEDLKFVRR